MSLPKEVTLYEVGLRDGLQNETTEISTANKVALAKLLHAAGLQYIEATSFVSPKWVPQLSDHAELIQQLDQTTESHYPVLVPNLEGMQHALDAGVKDIAVFTAASQTFSQKNTNCSIDESFIRIGEIVSLAKEHDISVRGYVSCALGCPYEGDIAINAVTSIAQELYELGCYQVSLGDTIGVGTPKQAQQLVKAVREAMPGEAIAVHFHDTYGQALANIYACLELGVNTIDASIGGLGGCPYAPGASGNVATEDVVYLLQGLGIECNVDLSQLLKASEFVRDTLKLPLRSRTAQALL